MDSPYFFLEYFSELYKPEKDWLFEKLLWKLQSGNHLTLIADQGWGIQDYVNELIFHLTEKNPDIRTCLVDIRPAHTSSSILDLLASAFQDQFPQETSTMEIEKGSLRILSMPGQIARKSKVKVVVFFANSHLFKRLPDYHIFLRTMKSRLRNQRNCVFCFYGNNCPFFRDLFDSNGPLSGLGLVFHLIHNPLKHRASSIRKLFHDHKKHIGHSTSIRMSYSVDNHPFYLRLLAWHSLILTRNTCTTSIVERALDNLIHHFEQGFNLIIEGLTEKQIRFLKALVEGNQRLYSEAARERYHLGSSGNITRLKSSLENRLIIKCNRVEIVFTDPIFREWLQRRYFSKF